MNTQLINQIIELEWMMFRTVNDDYVAGCQNDQHTFEAMRRAQFEAWSAEPLMSYLDDLKEAVSQKRNLLREKYIHMMKSTHPQDYDRFKNLLPDIRKEKETLIAKIWHYLEQQTLDIRKRYPALALTGRPLYAKEESHDWTSVETYMTGELLTYSENTLCALLNHIEISASRGISLAFLMQENSVTCLGFSSMDEAEKAMQSKMASLI